MLGPQVEAARLIVDDVDERIATLGGSQVGALGALVAARNWTHYDLGRDDAIAHLGVLEVVDECVVKWTPHGHRPDGSGGPVTQDLLMQRSASSCTDRRAQTVHCFVRADLEAASAGWQQREATPRPSAAGSSSR